MDDQAPNYRREFLASPHHAALGLFTLGLGFLSASLLGLIVGGTLYTLGWLHLPDMPLFRRWVDRRHELLDSLSASRRERYSRLAAVCRDIETASADNPLASPDPASDPRLRKLDELMWTYLRLLGIEQSLEQFLETERREDLPGVLKNAEAEATRLSGKVDALKAQGDQALLEPRQRYLGSRLERLEVLRKRQERIRHTQENLA